MAEDGKDPEPQSAPEKKPRKGRSDKGHKRGSYKDPKRKRFASHRKKTPPPEVPPVKPSKLELDRIRAEIIRLDATRQFENYEIAGILGIPYQQVTAIIKKQRAEFQHRAQVDNMAARNAQLAELHLVKSMCLSQYFQSLEDRESASVTVTGIRDASIKPKDKGNLKNVIGQFREISKIDSRDGNIAALRLYVDCIKQEREILGSDVPRATAGDPLAGGGAILSQTYNVLVVPDKLSIEQWSRVYGEQLEADAEAKSLTAGAPEIPHGPMIDATEGT